MAGSYRERACIACRYRLARCECGRSTQKTKAYCFRVIACSGPGRHARVILTCTHGGHALLVTEIEPSTFETVANRG